MEGPEHFERASGVPALFAHWTRRRVVVVLVLSGLVVAVVVGTVLLGGDDPAVRVDPARQTSAPPPQVDLRPRPQVVQITGVGSDDTTAEPDEVTPKRDPVLSEQSDAEALKELEDFQRFLRSERAAGRAPGSRAALGPDGMAVPPRDAPGFVVAVIQGGNAIARAPYRWGGGHGAWRDSGYDCSGSVSFALAGAGLLDRPLDSTGFMSFGAPGPGRWITIYSNPGHMFMVVAGLRFDTSGRGRQGTRWQGPPRSVSGFAVRHIPGL